jgi:hypothetical protein
MIEKTQNQIKSKNRVAEYGEVFTNQQEIKAMLNLLPFWNDTKQVIESTFLEPACGNGNFLVEIINRKLSVIDKSIKPNYTKDQSAYETAMLVAVCSIYGIDVMYDNVKECIERLYNIICDHYENMFKNTFSREIENCVYSILSCNIVCGNTLEMKDCEDKPIVFSKWTIFPNKCINKKEYIFKELINKGDEIFPISDLYIPYYVSQKIKNKKDVLFVKENVKKESYIEPSDNVTSMKFTVVCGNPPYQISDGGGTGDSAKPIYNKFIHYAKMLTPSYITMIIPSRWMKGGKGLDKFRQEMMEDTRLSFLYDFENAKECFPNIDLDGGICYFLWDAKHIGKLKYIYKNFNGEIVNSERYLKNSVSKLVLRDYRQISIIEKVKSISEVSFSVNVSSQKPYGFRSDIFNRPENYPDAHLSLTKQENTVKIYGVVGKKGGTKRIFGYVDVNSVKKNKESIWKYKLFFSKVYSPKTVNFPTVIKAKPKEICAETFLKIGDFNTEEEMINCYNYMHTNFFKVLLFFNRSSMNNSQSTFDFIPWQDFTQEYNDVELYQKYHFTQTEIEYINYIIRTNNKS